MKYDVFVCHASEDKEAVALPLGHALRERGLEVWLDKFQLRLGDSLRRKIDEGLRESRFGVVVLSPAFFRKEWPQWELDGLAQREIASGSVVILPIWHDVGYEEVAAYSPPLAAKLAASTAEGLHRVVEQVEAVFRATPDDAPTERVAPSASVPAVATGPVLVPRMSRSSWNFATAVPV